MTTLTGTHRFEVTTLSVVKPGDRSVLDPTNEPSLTLTTCNPAFRATERLVVHAALRAAVAVPDDVRGPAADLTADLSGPDRAPRLVTYRRSPAPTPTGGGRGRVLIGAGAAALVWGALRTVARRKVVIAWALLGAPLVATLVFLFDAVNRTLAGAM